MHLVTWRVHVVTGSNSTTQSNYGTSRIPKYCFSDRHRSAFVFHSWNQAFRILGFLGDGGNNVKDDSSDHITYFQSSHVQIVWSSHHFFRLLSLLSVKRIYQLQLYRGCWICEALFGLFCGTGSSEWILSSAVTYDAVVLWFLDTIFFNLQRSLSLYFGFRPLFSLSW